MQWNEKKSLKTPKIWKVSGFVLFLGTAWSPYCQDAHGGTVGVSRFHLTFYKMEYLWYSFQLDHEWCTPCDMLLTDFVNTTSDIVSHPVRNRKTSETHPSDAILYVLTFQLGSLIICRTCVCRMLWPSPLHRSSSASQYCQKRMQIYLLKPGKWLG